MSQSKITYAADDGLLRAAARSSELADLALVDRESLAAFARRHGADLATALLYTRIIDSERYRPFLEATARVASSWTNSRRPPLLVVVPGVFHRESMDTGADGLRFREIAESRGFRTERIETMSFGSNIGNAAIIRDWLSCNTQEVILVCLSKASVEVRATIQEAPGLCRNVMAVVNLSPVIFGSKLVDRVLDHPLRSFGLRCWMGWKGFDFSNLLELRYNATTVERPAPASPFVVNVCGFPLKRDLSSAMSRRQYRRLLPEGPNDGGGILLADYLRFPGTLFPIWGADHYLRQPKHLPDLIGQVLCMAATPFSAVWKTC